MVMDDKSLCEVLQNMLNAVALLSSSGSSADYLLTTLEEMVGILEAWAAKYDVVLESKPTSAQAMEEPDEQLHGGYKIASQAPPKMNQSAMDISTDVATMCSLEAGAQTQIIDERKSFAETGVCTFNLNPPMHAEAGTQAIPHSHGYYGWRLLLKHAKEEAPPDSVHALLPSVVAGDVQIGLALNHVDMHIRPLAPIVNPVFLDHQIRTKPDLNDANSKITSPSRLPKSVNVDGLMPVVKVESQLHEQVGRDFMPEWIPHVWKN